jgi:hypothetical protein
LFGLVVVDFILCLDWNLPIRNSLLFPGASTSSTTVIIRDNDRLLATFFCASLISQEFDAIAEFRHAAIDGVFHEDRAKHIELIRTRFDALQNVNDLEIRNSSTLAKLNDRDFQWCQIMTHESGVASRFN